MSRWILSLIGLILFVFGIVALSGPGRIDIEDGQARFEAGRNLIDHGDTCLRDPRLVWNKFPGRGGNDYTGYRLPQIIVAAACVAVSDTLSGEDESRRHFAFSLHGAVCAAMIAVLMAMLFRMLGQSERAAILWGVLSIFATPCWYYATSTFDEILTTLVAVIMLVTARASRNCMGWIILSAIAAGVLYNCKPPIVALALPALALAYKANSSKIYTAFLMTILMFGVVIGHGVMTAYELYKFPPEVRGEYDRIIREEHPPTFFGNVPVALVDMLAGPSSGVLWYFPPVWLLAAGLRRSERMLVIAYIMAAIAIVGFVSLLVFYKGGVCWGPRYLTPLFAAGWIFAPAGARALGTRMTLLLLGLGIIVQLLALSAIPERLYIQRELPSDFYLERPQWYLYPQLGHVVNRPREVLEMIQHSQYEQISPTPTPSYTLPVFHPKYFPEPQGQVAIQKYRIIGGPRVWWAWMPDDYAVNVRQSAIVFAIMSILGMIILAVTSRKTLEESRAERVPATRSARDSSVD